MSAKTKTALKAESNSTFTTNGVRAIKAVDHRAFNNDLIDSMDTVSLLGAVVTEKKHLVVINTSNFVFTGGHNVFDLGLLFSDVKDQAIASIIEVRLLRYCTSLTNIIMYPYIHEIPKHPLTVVATSDSLRVAVKDLFNEIASTSDDKFALFQITYIPAE